MKSERAEARDRVTVGMVASASITESIRGEDTCTAACNAADGTHDEIEETNTGGHHVADA